MIAELFDLLEVVASDRPIGEFTACLGSSVASASEFTIH